MSKEPKAYSRRQILQWAGLAGASGFVSGCESMDRLILGKAPVEDSVFVLGAGLAGLNAGVELKKQRIPFVIVDQGRTPGGRVRTLSPFAVSDEILELGGEWFSPQHTELMGWSKELRLESLERRPEIPVPLGLSRRESQAFLATVASLSQKASKLSLVDLHKFSCAEFIKRQGAGEEVLQHLRRWSFFRFGAEPEEIQSTLLEPQWWTFPQAQFRFRGGGKILVEGLFDRIAGILPQENFIWQHELMEVKRESEGYRLVFETPFGERSFLARRVICTLPPGALQKVEGMDSLCEGLNALRMGIQSKGGAYFQNRFWQASRGQSLGLRSLGAVSLWESERRSPQQGGGALSFAVGGADGLNAGPHTLKSWREGLVQSLKVEVAAPVSEHLQNWSQLKGFRGSHFLLSPGLQRKDLFRRTDAAWAWAGEHVSIEFPGTMEGALRSGKEAARQIAAVKV